MEPNRDRSSVDPSATGVDALLIDLDGVVWVGGDPIPGSVGAIDQLRSHGVDVVFLTNDPRAAPDFYAAKLTKVGLPTSYDEVITAGRAVAGFVARREGDGSHVLVIGSEGLHREVRAAGLTPCDPEAADQASAVVVGGHDDFHYAELRAAVRAVDAGATVYAAGRDATFPMPDGPWPATGAILAAVEYATGVRGVAVGKPHRFMFDLARERLPAGRRIGIVGDNLDADIAGGREAGLHTILVLTGSTRPDDLQRSQVRPDLVAPDLAAFARMVIADRHES
jgi:glycerol 3-phosphatase-2